jgi:hypothetical protein
VYSNFMPLVRLSETRLFFKIVGGLGAGVEEVILRHACEGEFRREREGINV